LLASVLPTAVLAQGAQGFGILGDSGSDEYRADDNRGGAYAVTTLGDRSATASIQAAFPDPAKRQRVTDAIVATNNGLRAMALQRGAVIVDLISFAESLFARIDANGDLDVGGEAISLTDPGDEPHHLLLGDNEHAGTVVSGLLANLFIASFNAAGNQRSSTARTVTIANPVPDTVAPTVTVTNPPAGSTVSGVLTVSATAADNVGVAGVRFKVDGADLGAEDTVTPFAVSWTTTTVANGSHTLSATARDAAGNTTTAAVSIVVDNGTAQFLSPGAYSVTRGAYQAGTVASVAMDDNAYLAIRSATSGLTGYATTDFEFTGVSSTASTFDFSVVVKSSASSTTVRLYVFRVSSQSWIQLNSYTVGTGESGKDVSITAGASGYRDAAGRVRLRVEGSKLLTTFTVSNELISLTARN
jgi:hypothetical protein